MTRGALVAAHLLCAVSTGLFTVTTAVSATLWVAAADVRDAALGALVLGMAAASVAFGSVWVLLRRARVAPTTRH